MCNKEIIDGKLFCPDCETWKPVEEFSKSAKSKTGRKNRCGKCEWQKTKTAKERHAIPNIIEDLEQLIDMLSRKTESRFL